MSINLHTIVFSLLVAPAMLTGLPAAAQNDDNNQAPQKTDYRFRQKVTPEELGVYNTIVFPLSPNMVSTMRGDELYSTKKTLNGLQINPTGISFGVIETDKKGKKDALFFSTLDADKKLDSMSRQARLSHGLSAYDLSFSLNVLIR